MITQTAVFILKITVSDEHEIDSGTGEGLSLLTRLLPNHIPWHYVLVVPAKLKVSASSGYSGEVAKLSHGVASAHMSGHMPLEVRMIQFLSPYLLYLLVCLLRTSTVILS